MNPRAAGIRAIDARITSERIAEVRIDDA